MKTLIIIILLVPTMLVAQNKNDNTIVVRGNISTEKIKSVLFQNSFSVTGTDTTFIITDPKLIKRASMLVKLMILKTDTATFIKPYGKETHTVNLIGGVSTERGFEQISFGRNSTSWYRVSWVEIDKIAHQMGSEITYTKQ